MTTALFMMQGTPTPGEGGGGGEEVRFGREAGGTDTFPSSEDRALASPYALAVAAASISQIFVLFGASSTAGTQVRAFLAADAGSAPSTIIGISAPVSVPAGGGWIEFPVSVGALAAGTYWLGFVADNFNPYANHQTTGGATMVMANGTFNFTSQATWPGNSATYSSHLCVYAVGTAA